MVKTLIRADAKAGVRYIRHMATHGWTWCGEHKKRRYLNIDRALYYRNASQDESDLPIRIYPCDNGGYHLTKKPLIE